MLFGPGEQFTHPGWWETETVEQENRALPGLGNSSSTDMNHSPARSGGAGTMMLGMAEHISSNH